jgi:hypothetical protein
MFAHTSFDLEFLHHWAWWAAPLVGLSSAGMMLLLTRTHLWRRNPAVPPPPEASEPSLDPFEQGSTGERRTSIRRAGKTIRVLISDAAGTANPFNGLVCDRSLNGLRLEVDQPVEVNTLLSVRPMEASISIPWIQVEVRRCYFRDGSWELGCQFIRTPPYSHLLLFG